MRLYAQLLFAAFVLCAHAATIPEKIVPELEKKLPEIAPEDTKVPTENVSSEQELIDQVNIVKEIENNLAKSAIPVAVVVEDVQPLLKINEVDDDDIKRPAVDLRNPGPPQRQEHETQNPESFTNEQQAVTKVKQNLQETQVLLRQGFQGVTDGIQNWITNSEQISTIQQNLQMLSESFTTQIQKLNETLQGFVNPSNPVETVEESQKKSNADFQKIETRLKILEDNFKNGVQTLSEGVQIVAHLRAENEAAGSASTTAPAATASPSPAQPSNPFLQYVQQFNTLLTSGFNNVTQAINNFVSQGPAIGGIQNIFNQGSTPAAVQADTPEGTTTQRPYPWQNWQSSLNNFLNPQGQAGQTVPPAPATPGPIVQAFQNLTDPIIQGVVNFIRPNRVTTTQKPAEAVTQAGTNAVPASSEKPAAAQSEPVAQPAPEVQKESEKPASEPSPGPIRQILENNPVVKGIAGAVQRIQSTINNPEKPRDTAEKSDTLEKGGFLKPPGYGYGGGGSGDNINGDGLNEQNAQKVEIAPEEPKKEKEVETMEKEQKPETVADKTE